MIKEKANSTYLLYDLKKEVSKMEQTLEKKNIPYSVIREAEETAKASGRPFRYCLESLISKLGDPSQCEECKEKARHLLTART